MRFHPRMSLLLLAAFTTPSFGDSSTTPSQITGDNGTVKSGDLIIWKVEKPITLQKPVGSDSTAGITKSTTTPGPSTGADLATAAADVKASADKLAKALSTPPAGATAADLAKSKAAAAASDQAAAAVLKANSDAFIAGADKSSSPAGINTALGKIVTDASQKATSLDQQAVVAQTRADTDSKASAEASKRASSKGATQDDKKAAQVAGDTAAKSLQASQQATSDMLAAHAYAAAATDALATVVSTLPASAPPTPSKTVDDGQVCFPSNSVFQVTNVTAASKTSGTDPAGTTVASNTQLVSGHFESDMGFLYHLHFRHRDSLAHVTPGSAPTSSSICTEKIKYALKDATYDFTSDQLSKQDFYRSGFTWGALVIPYKFYLSDRSFKSNTSTVAFAGYEGWIPGLSLSVVAALGPGLTTTSTTTPAPATGTSGTPAPAATTKSSTFVTYTIAGGLIAAFGDSKTVKAGLLFGRDYQGKDSGFQYENKNWLALSIGAGF